jgi:predicted dehydrogenase
MTFCLDRVQNNMRGRFHPSTRRVKEIIDSGGIGEMTKIEANLAVPAGFVKDGDIRLAYDLGGGGMMDMGCEFDVAISISPDSHSTISYRLHFICGAVPSRRGPHESHLS